MKISHAAESGHWYDRLGESRYTVKSKTGVARPTTIRDARTNGWLPSVTSIIRCAAAPGLETWKQQQVMLAALTLTRQPGETDEAFCSRVMHDSKEQARKAAERGTAIHAAIQGHFEGSPPDEAYWSHVRGVVTLLEGVVGDQPWVAEKSFAHPLGFGGKTDLHTPEYVLDFKTKEFSKADDLKTWAEHHMQLAAYREGLGYPKAECGIVYVSTMEPGLARLIWVDESDLQTGWRKFRSLLDFWIADRGYNPQEWKEPVAA